ncbi:hypothetical protein Nepgr_005762 [Nepenthes gracilis]|uniref:Uncharacterized protein n=1 Tax=Nepenthes gracilis TaxID=150966 RepID=A0AAD3S3S7_NEPGR|nr:hypothetical protein Nepgr_005762 [Nepenthes gracilis]
MILRPASHSRALPLYPGVISAKETATCKRIGDLLIDGLQDHRDPSGKKGSVARDIVVISTDLLLPVFGLRFSDRPAAVYSGSPRGFLVETVVIESYVLVDYCFRWICVASLDFLVFLI